jgi:hypothetical protein
MLPTGRKLLFACLLLAVPLLVLAAILSGSRPAPAPPLPNPNGYDDFVSAGDAIVGDVTSFASLTPEQLRGLVSSNAEPLRLTRLGLTRQCRFPLEAAATNIAAGGLGYVNLSLFKREALLLAAEGRLAELDGRPADAARDYADAIALGNRMSLGGPLITRLVGIACETIGARPLVKLAPNLSCDQARPILAALERIDQERVTWDEVSRAESRYMHAYLAQEHYYRRPILLAMGWWQSRAPMRRSIDLHLLAVARLRLITADLALRCYQSEQGRLPARLDDLVPQYLRSVPQDPFREQPLVFRPQGTNWLIYSVGPDGIDDGGKPLVKSKAGTRGDVLADSAW